MNHILPPETAHHLFCNNYFMVVQIIGIMNYLKIIVHKHNTPVINRCQHINLCLDIP